MSSDGVVYAIVIEQAGANYSAYAPDLPGVITTGATPEETEEHMREAISFHVCELRAAGEAVPPPRARTTYVRVA
jgi:predicted RNase H-like HicB family nuclease